MKELVEVVRKISNNKYLVKKATGTTQILNSDRQLSSEDTLLLINGNIAGVVYTGQTEVVKV